MHFGLPIIIFISVLAGCASIMDQPPRPALANSSWLAEDIEGTGVIDNLQSTIDFSANLAVSGNSGCNRFSGQASVSAQDIEFGPLAGTRMACPAAVMNQEERFYRALSNAVAWSIDTKKDLLTFRDSLGEPILRFSRMTRQN